MKVARVLVVEDESAIAELISINLRHNGMLPLLAADGVAAQKHIDEVLPDVILLDSKGIISSHRQDLNAIKTEFEAKTNPRNVQGGIGEALQEANVFIGVSSGTIAEENFARMSPDSMIFAMSNPDPEIDPVVAKKYAKVVATGRSDYPNQINNVLAFPGIFKGALDAGARRITQGMKIAAAQAIADLVKDELTEDYIMPSPLDERVSERVANAVALAAAFNQ